MADASDEESLQFECPYCSERFDLEIELETHVSNVHAAERQ